MSFNILNDWKSDYGFSIAIIGWFKLGTYRSFTLVIFGIGFSITKGSLDV